MKIIAVTEYHEFNEILAIQACTVGVDNFERKKGKRDDFFSLISAPASLCPVIILYSSLYSNDSRQACSLPRWKGAFFKASAYQRCCSLLNLPYGGLVFSLRKALIQRAKVEPLHGSIINRFTEVVECCVVGMGVM